MYRTLAPWLLLSCTCACVHYACTGVVLGLVLYHASGGGTSRAPWERRAELGLDGIRWLTCPNTGSLLWMAKELLVLVRNKHTWILILRVTWFGQNVTELFNCKTLMWTLMSCCYPEYCLGRRIKCLFVRLLQLFSLWPEVWTAICLGGAHVVAGRTDCYSAAAFLAVHPNLQSAHLRSHRHLDTLPASSPPS